MRTRLLFAALLAVQSLWAQMIPSEVNSPVFLSFLYNDIPNIRPGVTNIKLRTPVLNAQSYATWYDLGITYSSDYIATMDFTNIDPGNPLQERTRTTGSKTGNVYTAIVELYDLTWDPYERHHAYYDANGRDTLWVIESHNGTDYENEAMVRKYYDASGNFTGSAIYEYDGSDWSQSLQRNVGYSGGQRTTDTFYITTGGNMQTFQYNSYYYSAGKLDSIATFSADDSYIHSFKLTVGTDGGVDQVKTYQYSTSGDSIFVESRADFTGGAVGVREHVTVNFDVYPVPATGKLYVNLKDEGMHTIMIYDLQGRMILTTEAQQQATINVSEVQHGIYIMSIANKQGETTQERIVISR